MCYEDWIDQVIFYKTVVCWKKEKKRKLKVSKTKIKNSKKILAF